MKWKILCIILLVPLACYAADQNIYIDSSASDGGDGSILTPYNDFSDINWTTGGSNSVFDWVAAGHDVFVNLKSGETFEEMLTVGTSGASGHPITIQAYGTEDKPIISGHELVTNWSIYSGNIWEASHSPSNDPNQVFKDGVRQVRARWPNSGWCNIDSTPEDSLHLQSDLLTQADDYWIGAEVYIKTRRWKIENKTITDSAQGATTITWGTETNHKAIKDFGFYLENLLSIVDTDNEWYYDTNADKLYLYSSDDPNNCTIEVSSRQSNIKVTNSSYITIDGLELRIATQSNILIGPDDLVGLTIQNCSMSYAGDCGIKTITSNSYTDVTVTGNTIQYGTINSSEAIYLYNLLGNNVVSDNKILYWYDELSPKDFKGIVVRKSSGTVVSGNSLDSIAGLGIHIQEDAVNMKVYGNKVDNACLSLCDLGGIYVWGDYTRSLEIYRNIVCNSYGNIDGTTRTVRDEGHGIYLDEYITGGGISAYSNVIYGCSGNGVMLHNLDTVTVYDNTFYGNSTRQCYLLNDDSENRFYDVVIKNNIFVCDSSDQKAIGSISSYAGDSELASYDYNCYYSPSDTAPFQYKRGGSILDKTFAEWKALHSQDANSFWKNPMFLQASSYNLGLDAHSPCIDAGANTGVYSDFNSNPAPCGSGWDIGAYEYQIRSISGNIQINGNVEIH